jgi:hypothetical protein
MKSPKNLILLDNKFFKINVTLKSVIFLILILILYIHANGQYKADYENVKSIKVVMVVINSHCPFNISCDDFYKYLGTDQSLSRFVFRKRDSIKFIINQLSSASKIDRKYANIDAHGKIYVQYAERVDSLCFDRHYYQYNGVLYDLNYSKLIDRLGSLADKQYFDKKK